MTSKQLIIVFVKNLREGRVKTRLAKSIGNFAALEVYKELLKLTEEATSSGNTDTWVFYSNEIDDQQWPDSKKFVQSGNDLGEKMKTAFELAFSEGYESIVLIGSDLPGMNHQIINEAFHILEDQPVVFGPAEDGGYYLIGLNYMVDQLFNDKPWSQPNLLSSTLQELHNLNIQSGTLETLNDIDTIEDLMTTGFLETNETLRQTIELLND